MIKAKAVNHIGIAVRSIEAHRAYYENVLGARFTGIEAVADQKLNVAFFEIGPEGHAVKLELLEPTSEDSTIAKFIEKRGEGMHHIAYTVDDIEQRLAELKAGGIGLVDETSRGGAHNTRIAFLHPKSTGGVLSEMVEG